MALTRFVGNRVGCEMWSVFLAINSEAASSYKQIGCSCMYKNYDFWIYCSQETHLEKVVVERSHIIKDEFYSSGCEVRNISALKKFWCLSPLVNSCYQRSSLFNLFDWDFLFRVFETEWSWTEEINSPPACSSYSDPSFKSKSSVGIFCVRKLFGWRCLLVAVCSTANMPTMAKFFPHLLLVTAMIE